MALSQRDRRALILGGVALGAISLYLLAIEPLAVAYADLTNEHDQLAGRIARTVHVHRKAAYLAEQIAEYTQQVGELSPPKPYDEQITTVGEQIIAAAQKSGVQLRGATPTAAVPWAEDPALSMALFHIDAEAKWSSLMDSDKGWTNVFKFIAAVYRIPGVLSVEQFNLSTAAQQKGKSKGRQQGGTLALRLTVSVLTAAASESAEAWSR